MQRLPNHGTTPMTRGSCCDGALFGMRCGALFALALLLIIGLLGPATHAQHAVIIIDGEQVELKFDAFEQIRDEVENIQERIRNQRNRAGFRQFPPSPKFDIELPDDEELSRVQIDPKLLSHVTELNSDSYEAREQATGRLLDAPHEHVQFYAILSQQPLTTEQRNRLLMIVRQRLIQTPRGAVGISMRPPALGPDGRTHIEVADLIEGLPAERVIEVGDRITHLDGRPLNSSEELTIEVQSRRPGEQIVLNILRPKRDEQGRLIPNNGGGREFDELRIELTLGSADKLPNVNTGMNQSSTVAQMRRHEADLLMERFAPRHVTVEFDGSPSFDADVLEVNHPRVQQFIAHHIEQHPAIQQVHEHRRIMEEAGSDDVPRMILAQWRETEMQLVRHLEQDDLTPEHRAILEAVLNRFRELTRR